MRFRKVLWLKKWSRMRTTNSQSQKTYTNLGQSVFRVKILDVFSQCSFSVKEKTAMERTYHTLVEIRDRTRRLQYCIDHLAQQVYIIHRRQRRHDERYHQADYQRQQRQALRDALVRRRREEQLRLAQQRQEEEERQRRAQREQEEEDTRRVVDSTQNLVISVSSDDESSYEEMTA